MIRKLLILLTISSVMIVCFSSCYTHHGPHHRHAPHGHSKRVHKGKHGRHHGPKKHKKGKPRRSGVSENLMPRRR